jgi:hypothetical protein
MLRGRAVISGHLLTVTTSADQDLQQDRCGSGGESRWIGRYEHLKIVQYEHLKIVGVVRCSECSASRFLSVMGWTDP